MTETGDAGAGPVGVLLVLALVLACMGVVVFVPLLATVVIGRQRRTKLEAEIAARERQVAHLLAVTTPELGPGGRTTLVMGSIVYAPDAAARMAHRWRRLFGGAGGSMALRMESARKLATIRALEHASQVGARGVLNLRYETSDLTGAGARAQRPLIEIIVYGTAWVPG